MKTTNQLKKGDIVKLANGWAARLEDNKNGNVRLATVYGITTEMGSVYATDIVHYQLSDGFWTAVQHTAKQKAAQALRTQMFANWYL